MPPSGEGTDGAASAAPSLPDLAAGIREDLSAIGGVERTSLTYAIAAGGKLNAAKAHPDMARGQWLPWLRENFELSQQSASRYMALANYSRASSFGSIREALAALRAETPVNERPRARQRATPRTNVWEDESVLSWVRARRGAGRTRDEMVAESRAGSDGWPLGDRAHLPQNAADRAIAVVEDRDRREAAPETEPAPERTAGRRLHRLYRERRADPRALTDLQIAVMRTVGVLEGFQIEDVGIDDYERDLIVSLREDLARLREWLVRAEAVVTAAVGDQGQQRRLLALRTRADDPSSAENERVMAAQAYERELRRRAG